MEIHIRNAKKIILTVFCCCIFFLNGGCGAQTSGQEKSGEAGTDSGQMAHAFDDAVYVGEYLDSDAGDPNLEIAKGEDGTYIVQIGIYRLTTLDDGVGELTAKGMEFTATDAAGNPISGVITVENQTAAVTFTDSTWEYLENGSSFQYSKCSDSPNIWGE